MDQINGAGLIPMCIMVVEDEVLIRMILVEELEDAGFTVREGGSGDEAVIILRGITGGVSVLVTDIHMPGTMDGLDLAAHVRRLLPGTPIIFTTGQPGAMQRAPCLGPHETLIRKPYVPADVIRSIRDMLTD